MFENSLNQINNFFCTDPYANDTVDSWRQRQDEFIQIFHNDLKILDDITNKKPFETIFQYSQDEYILWPANSVTICEFRIRPKDEYYSVLKRKAPQPSNPNGPSATGLEVCIDMYRGVERENIFYPPNFQIKFEIWGDYERKKFKKLYRNYKRPIDLILNDLQLDFFTACVFENLEKYKGNDIVRKLNLYLPKKDPESLFFFYRTFNKNANAEMVKKYFINLLIIYHCCLGYCLNNQKLDIIFDYSNFLSEIISRQ